MSIKADKWIRRMAESTAMIEPFEPGQVRVNEGGERIVSYGTSSYGYDVRCADEFKIFTNINHAIVDPKAFNPDSFVDIKANTCIIPPNSFALARTVEYFRIPRNVLTVCLGKSTYARCFSGDTRVALVGGRTPTFEEMVRGAGQGERYFGYGVAEHGRIITTELEMPRLIGRDTLLELTLDNGKTIRATPDHEFMMRDGVMLKATDLVVGSSLMPLYRSLRRGYEMTYQPLTGYMCPTDRMADEWNLRHGAYEDEADTHRHHIDQIRTNSATWNIMRMNASEHLGMHNALTYGEDFDAQVVRQALDETGSLRGAARALGVDRSAFRRFPEVIAAFRGTPVVNHKVTGIRTLSGKHNVYCLSAPETGNFALEAGVFVSNCGIIVNVTPLEPEWEGHVTLEFSNTTPLPAKIYAHEGVAQMLFFESDEVCETSYGDRGGKYQGQRGVTLPRT